METLETLAGMLGTTAEIRSIVRTMKTLSAVSIRQYEQAEQAVSRYEQITGLGFSALLRQLRARGLPLPQSIEASGAREAIVVIGSDRGLCGRYNDIVTRHAMNCMGERTSVLAVVGARASARLQANGRVVDRFFLLPGSVAGMTPLVQKMIVEIDRWTRELGVGRVRIVHNRREGRSLAVPAERALLPIPDAYLRHRLQAGWPGPGIPFFRMDSDRLLSWLVRQRLFVVLYRALAEALASEHSTRLAAMQRAERNIEERQAELTASYRQVQQETVTRELMDIVSGFEAVNMPDD